MYTHSMYYLAGIAASLFCMMFLSFFHSLLRFALRLTAFSCHLAIHIAKKRANYTSTFPPIFWHLAVNVSGYILHMFSDFFMITNITLINITNLLVICLIDTLNDVAPRIRSEMEIMRKIYILDT